MNEHIHGRRLAHAALIALFLAIALPQKASAALLYEVVVDTTSIQGITGYIDLQLNVGNMVPTPAAIATLSSFSLGSSGVLGPPADALVDGDVTGDLSGTVVFRNTSALNAMAHPVTFGNSLSFMVEFSGDFIATPSSNASVFLAAFTDESFAPLLDTGDDGYSSVLFDLVDGSVIPEISTSGRADPVPEPAAWLMLGAGLLVLPLFTRMRLTRSKR